MIKKTTLATFNDGEYAGQYDWSGGIPLSVGEEITVKVAGSMLVYVVTDKKTVLSDDGTDQDVSTNYFFSIKK